MNQRSNADAGGFLAEEVWRARPPSIRGVWGAATQATICAISERSSSKDG
ncbi:MAG TPA: hypothetical protein V6D06_20615 [Trichocoleus sp.]